jgi:2-polyprenyl-3-methyl-5-hydroxy-6-metoxy-1,4-benzoquinol methylase
VRIKAFRRSKIPGDMDGILSQYLARKRIEAVKPYLKDKKKILDIGCGVFRWQNLLPAGAEYIGFDYQGTVIKYNQSHFPHQFFRANAETDDLSFCGGNFDLIMMLAAIEHFRQPEVVLKKIKRRLSPQGMVVLTTPHLVGNLILNLGAKFRIFSQDKETHYSLLNYQKIKRLALLTGYKIAIYKRFLAGFNQLVVLKTHQ